MVDHELPRAYRRPGPARRLLRSVLSEEAREGARDRVLDTPGLFAVATMVDPRLRPRRVSRSTDLVIEGFPRSANTYALVAFEHANGTAHRVSSHLHTPESVRRAVRLRLPVVLLVRDPAEVLVSTLQYSGRHSAGHVLRRYCSFYERTLPALRGTVVADFADVVTDFGAVIERCNARFGTTFQRYERTDAAESAVRARIEGVGSRILEADIFEQRVGRPSASRRQAGPPDLGPEEEAQLAHAAALYRRVLAGGVGGG